MKLLFLPLSILCVAPGILAASPVDALVSKARAVLGDEASLTSVRSLRVELSVAGTDGKTLGMLIDEYKAPMKERELDYTQPDMEVVTAIDGTEGHRVVRRMSDGARRLQILPAQEVNARRDLAAANLYLLAIPSAERGGASVAPDETCEGVACTPVDYRYKSGLSLRRFIDKASGRLVATRVDMNGKIGELMVNAGEQKISGITFPKAILIKDSAGKLLRTITVAKVEVNPEIDDSRFVTPIY